MAGMVRAMPRLASIAVAVGSARGRQVAQLAVIEAPLRRAKVLYNPTNRWAAAQGAHRHSHFRAHERRA